MGVDMGARDYFGKRQELYTKQKFVSDYIDVMNRLRIPRSSVHAKKYKREIFELIGIKLDHGMNAYIAQCLHRARLYKWD